MRILISLINACLILGLTLPAIAQTKRKKWQPATYKGLTVGKSTLADTLRVFGQPVRKDFAEPDAESDEIWYVYNDAGEFPGQFTVAINKKTKRVTAMMIAMLEDVKKETVLERLGNDYEVVRYAPCPDFDESESGPFYESSNGPAVYFEYRSRGITVTADSRGMVYGVDYLRRPPGLSSRKQCPPDPTKQRNTRRKVARVL